MADTQQNQTPRNVLSGLFGPKFLDDPEALSGMAASLGMPTGPAPGSPATSPSPDASAAPDAANAPIPGPFTGVVPKSFNEWATDPVNLAKIPRQINNSPLPGASPQIPPLIARPQDDYAPSAAPMAPQGQDTAPRGVTQGAAVVPGAAIPAAQPAPAPSTPPVFPNRADWLAQNPNAAAIPAPPHKYGTRGSIAMALATIGDTIGASLSGGKPVVGPHWLEQVQAGQEYQRNLPVLTQQAQTAAYEKAQGEAKESAGIAGTQANTAHVVAETNALLGGGPFYEQAGKARQEIQQLWQSGSVSPADFEKSVALKIQGLAPNVQRLIPADFVQQVKGLPQQPPSFKIEGGTIQPLTWQGQQYGVEPAEGEPALVTQGRNNAIASIRSNANAPDVTQYTQNYLKANNLPDTPENRLKAHSAFIKDTKVVPQVTIMNATNPMSGAPAAGSIPGTGEDSLKGMKPNQASLVRMVANYEADPDKYKSNRNPAVEADLIAAAKRYNPAYDQTTYGEKIKLRKDIGTQSQAFNTATHHLDMLNAAIDNLNNTSSPIWNRVKNEYKIQTGSDANANFEAVKNAVAGELSKVFKGGIASDSEIEAQNKNLTASSSPAALKGAVKQYIGLMQGRLQGLEETYEGQVGIKPNFQIVSPRAQEVFTRAGQSQAPQRGFAGGNEQLPPQAASQLQEGHETTFANGQTWTLRGGKQVRVK